VCVCACVRVRGKCRVVMATEEAGGLTTRRGWSAPAFLLIRSRINSAARPWPWPGRCVVWRGRLAIYRMWLKLAVPRAP